MIDSLNERDDDDEDGSERSRDDPIEEDSQEEFDREEQMPEKETIDLGSEYNEGYAPAANDAQSFLEQDDKIKIGDESIDDNFGDEHGGRYSQPDIKYQDQEDMVNEESSNPFLEDSPEFGSNNMHKNLKLSVVQEEEPYKLILSPTVIEGQDGDQDGVDINPFP